MKEQVVNIETLVQDDHNFNKGTEAGRELMERSFKQLGAGRSILIDKDGHIIAGNKSQLAAMAAGIKKVRIIETQGDELVAVKRTDLTIDSKEGRELALADNLTTQINLQWDEAELQSVAAQEGIDIPDWGLELEDLNISYEDEIERKSKEFEERMANGENLEEDEEYQAFKEKFKQKKTTDDCYTPELVYEAVADWVAKEYNLNRRNFVRPFYPGGDYQKEKYPKDSVVVDNPPFSILAEIVRFYNNNGIKFFIFAPSVTIINYANEKGVTALCIGVNVTYANGAQVATSFITNLDDPEIVACSSPSLYQVIKEANDKVLEGMHKQLPSYSYPDHIFTAAMGSKFSKYGQTLRISRNKSQQIGALDAQKESGKAIYGYGLLLSDSAAAEKAAAEKAAAEKAAAEKAAATQWELSDREKSIVEQLNKQAICARK